MSTEQIHYLWDDSLPSQLQHRAFKRVDESFRSPFQLRVAGGKDLTDSVGGAELLEVIGGELSTVVADDGFEKTATSEQSSDSVDICH